MRGASGVALRASCAVATKYTPGKYSKVKCSKVHAEASERSPATEGGRGALLYLAALYFIVPWSPATEGGSRCKVLYYTYGARLIGGAAQVWRGPQVGQL